MFRDVCYSNGSNRSVLSLTGQYFLQPVSTSSNRSVLSLTGQYFL
jgi:hypothetical protein